MWWCLKRFVLIYAPQLFILCPISNYHEIENSSIDLFVVASIHLVERLPSNSFLLILGGIDTKGKPLNYLK